MPFIPRGSRQTGFRGGVAAMLAAACLAAATPEPITPREPIALFNGTDLSGFTTWLPKFGRDDPDRVFTVVDHVDGAPAIRISGQHWGGLITRQAYADYRLVVEFRWGFATWAQRKNKARDSGVLLHCQGEEGNRSPDFSSPWMHSIEAQIIEGGTGDILALAGHLRKGGELIRPRLTATVTPGTSVWNPAGNPIQYQRRIDWQYRDPEWKDVLGFRGRRDVEKPVGEWNRYEIICAGGDVIYFLNGVKVNEGRDGSLRKGRIFFQSEGAEIYFRRIELHPLKP